jgi:hypothetical protein
MSIESTMFPLTFDHIRDAAAKVYQKKQDKALDFSKYDLYKMTLAKSPSNDAKIPHQMMLCEPLDEEYTRNRGGEVKIVIFDKSTIDGKHSKKSGSASDPAKVRQIVIGQLASSAFSILNTTGKFPGYMHQFHINSHLCTNRDAKVGAVRNLFYCAGQNIPDADKIDWSNAMGKANGGRAIEVWLQNFDPERDTCRNIKLPNGISFAQHPPRGPDRNEGGGNRDQSLPVPGGDKLIVTRAAVGTEESECAINLLELKFQIQLSRDFDSAQKRYKHAWFTLLKVVLNPQDKQKSPYFVVQDLVGGDKISLPIDAFVVEDPMIEDENDPIIEEEG